VGCFRPVSSWQIPFERMGQVMHEPVLLKEVVELMGVKPGGTYIDGTFGGGGHAEAILDKVGADGKLIGIDRDSDALERAAERCSGWGSRCALECGDFADMDVIAKRHQIEEVDGILLDLGMSSNQVDEPGRGFSFNHDGPLDMRMDRTQDLTAAKLISAAGERELADMLYQFGEEKASRRIARMIVNERDRQAITSTRQLAELVTRAKGGRHGKTHPATKTFQALRMAVNHELESLSRALEKAIRLVHPGGRVAVISFHSIEDRLVKRTFAHHVGRWESLPAGGERWVGEHPVVRRITRKPVTASEEELRGNPRARSAKLRVIERTEEEY